MIAQQLNKKQTTITRLFKTFLSKSHSITEQAIRDRAITEIVISQNLLFIFTEDKMFKRFAKIVDSRITVTWINEIFELNKAVLAITSLKYSHTANAIVKCIKDILEHWHLKNKIYSITTNSRVNVKSAYNKLARGSTSINSSTTSIEQRNSEGPIAIIITKDEWTTVANIINILKPFNDITNYISDSSYSTISIIYPTMSTLQNVLLKEFEDKDNSTDEPIKISDKDENAEEFKSPAVTTDLVKSIKKIMSKLFE
ncbi:39643_t:CDS:2, partial [Gigaspora margarita]